MKITKEDIELILFCMDVVDHQDMFKPEDRIRYWKLQEQFEKFTKGGK